MNSLTDGFKQPMPTWVREIKSEALQKITLSPFATACRGGDMGLTKELFLRFWPFVDAFPKIINRGCLHILKKELVKTFGLEMIDLFRLGFQVLSSMQKDEEDHRQLWLKTSHVLGLTPIDLRQPPTPEVKAVTSVIAEDVDPYIMFLRFVGVEVVAESVSEDFLSSEKLKSTLGKEGLQWFEVHVTHEGMSHEELAFRLARALHRGELTREESHAVIQHVVDLFIGAAEVCVAPNAPQSTLLSSEFGGERSAN
jgi:hypothetical protein